jgi:oligosaccharide translocation protein RFT1
MAGNKVPESSASTAFKGAKLIMVVSVLQRIITFAMNQLILHYTTPDVFGFAAVSLELLLSTLLFLSREGIRLACLREKITTSTGRQAIVNVRRFRFKYHPQTA